MNKTKMIKRIDDICGVGYANPGSTTVIWNHLQMMGLATILTQIVDELPDASQPTVEEGRVNAEAENELIIDGLIVCEACGAILKPAP